MAASVVNTSPPTDAELEAAGWVKLDDQSGFIALVGPLWWRNEADGRYCFIAEAKHRNTRGNVQGGMLMTFADRTLGHLVRAGNPDRQQATIQLDMRFMDGAPLGHLIEAKCQIKRRTGSLAFVEAEIFTGSRILATATGIWKIIDRPNPA